MPQTDLRTGTVFDLSMTTEGDQPFHIELKRTEHVGGPKDGEVVYTLSVAADTVDEFFEPCDHYACLAGLRSIASMMKATVHQTHILDD